MSSAMLFPGHAAEVLRLVLGWLGCARLLGVQAQTTFLHKLL